MSYEAELNKLNELLTRSHSSASLRDVSSPASSVLRRSVRALSSSKSSSHQRQAFQEYLLHLASLPSYDTKSRFATHIHRTFATFDQDQDPVIDAVMDLCEDRDVKVCPFAYIKLRPALKHRSASSASRRSKRRRRRTRAG